GAGVGGAGMQADVIGGRSTHQKRVSLRLAMRGENGYPRIRKSSKTMSAYEAAAVTNDAPSGQKPSFWGRTSLRAGQHRQCPDLGNRSCWLRPLTRLQVSGFGEQDVSGINNCA